GLSFCLYLILAGLARFLVEFLRINPEVLWGLTDAQLVGIAMIFTGIAGTILLRKRPLHTPAKT
ncbi:MAG: prolipoprotein diacylglyceryl transferase, partial [bacterium]|nr:prolipoprotein diacylglyceryl transferase [bacterium]